MRLKNIFLTVAVAGFLYSCTSEDYVGSTDPIVDSPEEITFDVRISLGNSIKTKAIGDEGNDYADNDGWAKAAELVVTNCAIAVFDFGTDGLQPANLIGFERVDITDGNKTTVNDTLAYKVSGVSAKMQKVRILAIANSALTTELNKFEDFATADTPYTYSQFKNLVESTDFSVPEFNPETLVKMGEIDHEFTATNYKDDVVVPMEQLAARVDLKITVDFEKELIREHYEVLLYDKDVDKILEDLNSKKGSNDNDKIIITYPDGSVSKVYNCEKQHWKLYYGGTELGAQNKIGHFESALVCYTQENRQYALYIKSITIDNLQTKTNIILPYNVKESNNAYYGGANKEELCKWGDNYANTMIADELALTFYTYEKVLYNLDKSRAVTISVEADVQEIVATTTKQYLSKVGIHAVLTKNDGNGNWELQNGNSRPAKFSLCDGEESKIEMIDDSTPILSEWETAGNSQSYSRNFAFIINPSKTMPNCNTDGLIHGNIYTLGVTIDGINTDCELEYAVVPWNDRTIDIPAFN